MSNLLAERLAEYRQQAATATAAELAEISSAVKAAREAYQAGLRQGVEPCAECGRLPHVIEQQRGSGNLVLTYYEVGCLVCSDRRVKSQALEAAITAWNEAFA